MSPPLPSVDSPVLSAKLPELAKFADPVDMVIFPLAPSLPAFEDKMLIDPLPSSVLPPLRTVTFPPLFCLLAPARMLILPPIPDCPVPTDIVIEPPTPALEAPLDSVIAPDAFAEDAPVLIPILPLLPLLPAFVDVMTT